MKLFRKNPSETAKRFHEETLGIFHRRGDGANQVANPIGGVLAFLDAARFSGAREKVFRANGKRAAEFGSEGTLDEAGKGLLRARLENETSAAVRAELTRAVGE